jgi:hypothetical protein
MGVASRESVALALGMGMASRESVALALGMGVASRESVALALGMGVASRESVALALPPSTPPPLFLVSFSLSYQQDLERLFDDQPNFVQVARPPRDPLRDRLVSHVTVSLVT